MKSVDLSNVGILMRGINYSKEVGVVKIWSDIYRDHGDYI
jgi:hypothetical protein